MITTASDLLIDSLLQRTSFAGPGTVQFRPALLINFSLTFLQFIIPETHNTKYTTKFLDSDWETMIAYKLESKTVL